MASSVEISEALRSSLSKICRLCGLNNPEKVRIISNKLKGKMPNEKGLDEKIQELLGITVTKGDKMPQELCSFCEQKINDFYEFRELCHETDLTTRELLGLKIKPIYSGNDESLDFYAVCTKSKRGRKRKSVAGIEPKVEAIDEYLCLLKQRRREKAQDPTYRPQRPPKKLKLVCNICGLNFCKATLLQSHRRMMHKPIVYQHFCYDCNAQFKDAYDFEEHLEWHESENRPTTCPLCGDSFKSHDLTSLHIQDHNDEMISNELHGDITCPHCEESFQTHLLFNIHPCVVQTLLCCGCSLQLFNKSDYFRHITSCVGAYSTYADVFVSAPFFKMESFEELNEMPIIEMASEQNLRLADKLLKSAEKTLKSIKNEEASSLDFEDTSTRTSYSSMFTGTHQDSDFGSVAENVIQARDGASINIKEVSINQKYHTEDSDYMIRQPFIPRIKIKLEHGQLNSTIINCDRPVLYSSRNKKKKQQNYGISKESQEQSEIPLTEEASGVNVKQENFSDHEENVGAHSGGFALQAPLVMTSIPKEQMDFSSREVENIVIKMESEMSDIKPSHSELKTISETEDVLSTTSATAQTRIVIPKIMSVVSLSENTDTCSPTSAAETAHTNSLNILIKQEPPNVEDFYIKSEPFDYVAQTEANTMHDINESARSTANIKLEPNIEILETDSNRNVGPIHAVVNKICMPAPNFKFKVEKEDPDEMETSTCNRKGDASDFNRICFNSGYLTHALNIKTETPSELLEESIMTTSSNEYYTPLRPREPVQNRGESNTDHETLDTEALSITASDEKQNDKNTESQSAEISNLAGEPRTSAEDAGCKVKINSTHTPVQVEVDSNFPLENDTTDHTNEAPQISEIIKNYETPKNVENCANWEPCSVQQGNASNLYTASNEEEQNVINSEILSSNSSRGTPPREVLENQSNEWHLEQLSRVRQGFTGNQLISTSLINVNEIAENNNNANIERQMSIENRNEQTNLDGSGN